MSKVRKQKSLNGTHRKTCAMIFSIYLFVAKHWKQHKSPSTGEQTNKLWQIHNIEFYSRRESTTDEHKVNESQKHFSERKKTYRENDTVGLQ